MKKVILIFITAAFTFVGCSSDSKKETIDLVSKLNSLEVASTAETYMTDSLATLFPETLMFLGRNEDKSGHILLMNTLPTTFSFFKARPDFTKFFSWVNITLIKSGDHTLGLLPRHAFADDTDIVGAMSQHGMSFSEKKDLICIKLKKTEQSLSVMPMSELDGKKISGNPCTVRTLNCTGSKGELCQYVITGKVYWIDDVAKKELLKYAHTSDGGPIPGMSGRGMYVVRVADSLWKKIPGMSGGSVVVSLKGKDFLLGLNTERVGMRTVSEQNDTTMVAMLAIQPIVLADIIEE